MFQRPEGSALCDAPALCPECQGPLTSKRVCWACCDRACPICGSLTGSAFIEFCWPCSYQSTADSSGKLPGALGGREIA